MGGSLNPKEYQNRNPEKSVVRTKYLLRKDVGPEPFDEGPETSGHRI